MKKALVFTAYDRLRYLQNTLFSWETVRGLDDWHVVFRVEPSDITEHVVDEFRLFAEKMNLQDYEIIVNSTKLGVLLHPFVAFDSLFAEGYDFVARVEDDVIVSDDILEYFDSMAKSYRDDPKVATVCAFTETQGYEDAVYTDSYFDPLNWGTWSDRWEGLIRDTWDWNYSTFNDFFGNEAGWDWNLRSRIIPQNNLVSVFPVQSRSKHIGVEGTHGTAENFKEHKTFYEDIRPTAYIEVD